MKYNNRGWVDDYLREKGNSRQHEWSDSIAVGNKAFVEQVKQQLGFKAMGRQIVEQDDGCHLREEMTPYTTFFGAEKGVIGPDNTYFWDVNSD